MLEEGRGADGEVAGGEVEEFLHDVGVLLWGLRVCVGVMSSSPPAATTRRRRKEGRTDLEVLWPPQHGVERRLAQGLQQAEEAGQELRHDGWVVDGDCLISPKNKRAGMGRSRSTTADTPLWTPPPLSIRQTHIQSTRTPSPFSLPHPPTHPYTPIHPPTPTPTCAALSAPEAPRRRAGVAKLRHDDGGGVDEGGDVRLAVAATRKPRRLSRSGANSGLAVWRACFRRRHSCFFFFGGGVQRGSFGGW